MANQILYGFHNLQDLKGERATAVGIDVINTAVNNAVEEHNRLMNQLLDFFVMRTTAYSARFSASSNARLQPLDNSGRARPIKAGGHYDVAFPINQGGTAWGFDYVTGQKLTVGEVQNAVATMNTADRNWVVDHVYGAILSESNWTYNDPLKGALTIKGLANGDTDTYSVVGGTTASTADHYLAQAAAISDAANPFPTIYNALTKRPENSGQVIAFVPTNLVADVEALADFKELNDPNIRQSANSDVLVGRLPANTPGRVIGYTNKVWIAESLSLPDNYIVATTTDGEKALAMREDEEASLQGFKKVADRDDYPWYERQYLRRAGFGAWNRVGAVAMRIGNAAYAAPTGFESPMG